MPPRNVKRQSAGLESLMHGSIRHKLENHRPVLICIPTVSGKPMPPGAQDASRTTCSVAALKMRYTQLFFALPLLRRLYNNISRLLRAILKHTPQRREPGAARKARNAVPHYHLPGHERSKKGSFIARFCVPWVRTDTLYFFLVFFVFRLASGGNCFCFRGRNCLSQAEASCENWGKLQFREGCRADPVRAPLW